MSEFRTATLNAGLLQGNINEKTKAWHYARVSVDDMIASGHAFTGPVPLEIAERHLDNGKPDAHRVKVFSHYAIGDNGQPLLDDNGDKIEVWEEIASYKAIVLPVMAHEGRFTIDDRISYMGSKDYRIHNPRTVLIDNVEEIMRNGCELETAVVVGPYAATSWRPAEGRVHIAGFGDVQPFINASTAANGRMQTTIHTSLVRQVCDNTIRLSFGSARNKYEMRHDSSHVFTADEACRILEITHTVIDAVLNPFVQTIGNIAITESDLRSILNIVDPLPEDATGVKYTRCANRRGEVFTKFVGHDPRITDDMKGTLLGAWQAWNTTKNWTGSKAPVTRNWKRDLTNNNIDAEFWQAVGTLGLAPESVLALV